MISSVAGSGNECSFNRSHHFVVVFSYLVRRNDEESALAQLREENLFLTRAKKQVEEDFLSYKREVAVLREENSMKEVKILKKVIKNLEEEILKEHAKHQKYANKKSAEVKELLKEIERLHISERLLKSRVKNLTHELASAKQVYKMSPIITLRKTSERRRSDPGERNFSAHRFCSSKFSNKKPNARRPRRKLSTENIRFSSTARTPSPSVARFDPTAYIKRKRRQQLEIDARLGKLKASVGSRSRSNSTEKQYYKYGVVTQQTSNREHQDYPLFSKGRSYTSSQASSNQSSVQSESDGGSELNSIGEEKQRKPLNTQSSSGLLHDNSEESSLGQRKQMTEIDARLNALQEFMKRSLESAKKLS